nr:RNA-directed DNA polymerase, eukaryota [Tanacetum cinerariifolium]
VLVDGIWMESPSLVKNKFFDHFKNRFEQPLQNRIQLERDFLNRITTDQNEDLEREVSKKEIKRAVHISLIRSLYKIISKILANRLVMVLGDLVNEIQFAFVADRQILDGPFILNELVQWYDILKKFSFGEKWCKWIQSCLHSSKGSVIVNESPMKEFQFYKGLFKGIKVASSLYISYLFYADDAIFTGSRVGGLMSQIQSWNDIIESMVSRLSRWKLKTLSIGGRLTLLKSVLELLCSNGFISQQSSLWASVIKALHGEDGKIGKNINTSYPSIWLRIIHGVELLKSQAWRGDVAFKVLVPRLYALETMKNIDVASKLSHDGLEFSFKRNPRVE